VCTLHVYTTLSGLISCAQDGSIFGCNENFVLLLLGRYGPLCRHNSAWCRRNSALCRHNSTNLPKRLVVLHCFFRVLAAPTATQTPSFALLCRQFGFMALLVTVFVWTVCSKASLHSG
jgi:hypothetical protein